MTIKKKNAKKTKKLSREKETSKKVKKEISKKTKVKKETSTKTTLKKERKIKKGEASTTTFKFSEVRFGSK